MERMSADTTSDTAASSKPLIALLNAPAVETENGEKPSASQCCGGGSCSL
ncbi:hypothetical protein DEU35_3179 [Microbacterium sp. AG157]|uniref:Uncharacterized protein n=1 Tax=Microbacterium testaceum TaxID=2033 RepID=A0A4Y3QPZ0_MICTE|nr:hypothetical protein DEU35_3179 [Microbacterium sp. AG157]GEB46180.1 hypothetical protein MTE01_21250 [Microbacterium testaceum]